MPKRISDETFIKRIFLLDPSTGEKLKIDSCPIDNKDGTFSFLCWNETKDTTWKFTIRIEEVIAEKKPL